MGLNPAEVYILSRYLGFVNCVFDWLILLETEREKSVDDGDEVEWVGERTEGWE